MVHPQSNTAWLARKRLEASNKYLPVSNSVRQKLQERQETQEVYTESTELLFKPVTKSLGQQEIALARLSQAVENSAETSEIAAEKSAATAEIYIILIEKRPKIQKKDIPQEEVIPPEDDSPPEEDIKLP
ncbi:hypothetical protein ACJMK2_029667 [Sinanodonta woodiana]|uniref:Uncharacterized protein n=1 Tax=Sinanodonta woodiana TaxID=1069815 RepID=A0ABD3XAV9_SINWO